MKKQFVICRNVLLLLAISIILALPGKIFAAEELTISPVRIDKLVNPGDVLLESIKVSNDSDTPKTIYAFLRDFKSEGEEGVPKLIVPGSESGSYMSSWIDISPEGVLMGPGEERNFPFHINIPKDAGPGGYYGAIIFGTMAPDVRLDAQEKGAAIGIAQQAGSLVLLQIAGKVDENAIIREFVTDKGIYGAPFNVMFASRIENQGNVHLKPRGTIEISNMLGKKVEVISVNDKSANVLPSSVRRFDNPWQGNFGLGRYKATLALSFGTPAESGGQGMQSITSVTFFWIMPWNIIGFIVLGLAFFFFVIYLFLKLYKNRAIKKAMKDMGVGREYYVKKYKGPSPAIHLGLTMLIIMLAVFLIAAAVFFLFF